MSLSDIVGATPHRFSRAFHFCNLQKMELGEVIYAQITLRMG